MWWLRLIRKMPQLKISNETLVTVVCVILRTPALFLMEVWCRTNPHNIIQLHSNDLDIIVTIAYYMALIVAVAIATLPLRHLVTFYIYLVCAGLMACACAVSRTFVSVEKLEVEQELEEAAERNLTVATGGGLFDLLEDHKHVERLVLHVMAQVFIAAVVAYLMEIKNWVKFTLLSFALPVVARLIGFPVSELHLVHNFATIYTDLLVLFCIFNHLGNIIDTCKEGLNFAFLSCRTYGIIPVTLTFWRTTALPVQLLLFWTLMFTSQLYVYIKSDNLGIWKEGWLVILLASMGECCATLVSLLALCVTITYASCAILCVTKLYLQGLDAFEHDTMRGWTEGFTMMLIAIQTDLLELKPLQRAFLMSILLFIVASSLIQSMYEIADPILLALSASHNPSIVKHAKALALCLILWMLPLYMTYVICQYFDLDFWLMVIVSSCLLTSVQVGGSLVVYTLFMYDFMRSEPWENLDDVIYCARAVTRVMEFIVAVFVVCFGLKESMFGEWSWINSIILVVHCYFNVWQRLQSGWKSFLLRWEAAKKVESLPQATAERLSSHDDVCAICYSEMKVACVTPCDHIFHGVCLRKWLYVKETCPMCHRDLAGKVDQPMEPEVNQPLAAAEPFYGIHNEDEDFMMNGAEVHKRDSSDNSSSSSCVTELDGMDLDYDETELAEADQ